MKFAHNGMMVKHTKVHIEIQYFYPKLIPN